MGLLDKLKGINSKVTEIRNRNIQNRERKASVKNIIEGKAKKAMPDLDNEAKKLAKQYNISHTDALEYLKDKRKSEKRKETVSKIAGALSQIGQNAQRMSANMDIGMQQHKKQSGKHGSVQHGIGMSNAEFWGHAPSQNPYMPDLGFPAQKKKSRK